MPQRVVCHLCGRAVSPHGHYVVRIDVFADPAMPPLDEGELGEREPADVMRELIEQIKQMTPGELQDDVHRRFEYRLCRPCQMKFLQNPLGAPRENRPTEN